MHGYRWLDAISHEYMHYLIVKLTANKAPIWFHEGLAKYEVNEMQILLQQWQLQLKESTQNITQFYNINFEHDTSYNVAKKSLNLDFTDPTSMIVQKIVNDLL
jgi:hypothetical protein